MNGCTISEVLRKFVRKNKNYRSYDIGSGIVKKVFNCGMGAIDFYRVYEDKYIIAVNKLFWNKTDERKLEMLKDMLGGNWRIVWCAYGYPEWYSHKFSLKYAIDENERGL